jgi:light-regulated signal transduction histidine kinase (bacteriophytochrome)
MRNSYDIFAEHLTLTFFLDNDTGGLFSTATGIALSWGVTSLLFAGLVIWQGVTIHQYDSQIRLQADVLERSNQELQQFAYIASHDLQAPLRSISGFVQLLQQTYQGQLDDEADDWIKRTVASVQQMQVMIRDILAYSRVDSRIGPLEPVPLAGVFNEVSEVLADSIRESNAIVTCGQLPTITGDRSQLVQLLQNLIGNALKYHSDQPPHVHVSAEKQGKEWVVAVQDNGIGIEPQYQERVFGIFRRLHTQSEYPGTGIGLAVCRRVVERHGDKIRVTSVPGQGSTFYFTIPHEEVV